MFKTAKIILCLRAWSIIMNIVGLYLGTVKYT